MRGQEKGTSEVFADPVHSKCNNRFDVSKSSAIPANPSLDTRHVSDEETALGLLFGEIVGSLMRITTPKKPDIVKGKELHSRGFRMTPRRCTTWRHTRFSTI